MFVSALPASYRGNRIESADRSRAGGSEECRSALAIARLPCYCASVILSFANLGSEDLFNGKNSKHARKLCPRSLWRVLARKLDQLDSAESLEDLRIPPGNLLEALTGDRRGQHSIRVNQQYRICFEWSGKGPEAVEVVDYH